MLWAMGDVYEDRLKNSYNGLKNQHGTRVMVDQERQFVGLRRDRQGAGEWRGRGDPGDAARLPARPSRESRSPAKKHVFCEKPMATDMPGLRRVMESAKKAKGQGTQLMSGFCWRYAMPERAMYGEINDGALGEIESVHSTYHTGPLGNPGANARDDRHGLRVAELAAPELAVRRHHRRAGGAQRRQDELGDGQPVRRSKCNGAGGAWASGRCRAWRHLRSLRGDLRVGERRSRLPDLPPGAQLLQRQHRLDRGEQGHRLRERMGAEAVESQVQRRRHDSFRFKGATPSMYQTEHNELFKAIRDGELINDGDWMTQSVAMGLMGREAGYSGRTITWDEIMNSQNEIVPADPKFGPRPPIVIPQPGVYKFS